MSDVREPQGWGSWEDAERWRRESFARCDPRARLAWLDDVWCLGRSAPARGAAAAPVGDDSSDPPLKRLEIDLEDLAFAMEFDGEARWYLDRDSGEVLMDSDLDPEETADIAATIEAEPQRYLAIEPIGSHEGFRIMRRFIDTVSNPRDADALLRAIEARKPFRAFKDALHRIDGASQVWFAFHDAAVLEQAIAWLESEGIEPVHAESARRPA